ncbi:Protein NipSnap [Nymphon striatum]|nr:Protein NipSnap [Nymphon striatum]
MSEYLQKTETYSKALEDKEKDSELVGLLDMSLWRYKNGYTTTSAVSNLQRSDPDLIKLNLERTKLLRSRSTQYLLPFSFWADACPREGPHIYEIRTYALKAQIERAKPFFCFLICCFDKSNEFLHYNSSDFSFYYCKVKPRIYFQPGTMIEWGNNWARAINYRRAVDNNVAVGGYFSQVGKLYNVHHIWAYKNLSKRKEIREATWRNPGWDQCVAYTVPLIETMESRLMVPASFSPLQ